MGPFTMSVTTFPYDIVNLFGVCILYVYFTHLSLK